ncbi:MAG: proline iminopeptidase-family hydrolase [Bacilli bacterium]|nr:proline iminopeptidase-family hydrolase [Bacilli bacterium]
MNKVIEGYIPFKGYKTYYRIIGSEYKSAPLVFLHGGPGSTHNAQEIFDKYVGTLKRPLIMYDQLGCGKSIIEGSHKELWVADTWVEELENLRNHLHLDKICLLGHSWGGMLAIIYLCDHHPEGVERVILSSTLSSSRLWESEAMRLIKELPIKDQVAINEAIEANDFSSKSFKLAMKHYYLRHVSPPKKDLPACCKRKKPKSEVYETAWGPCEFKPLGTLLDYDYTSKLHQISVPILLISGTDDESTPLQNKIMFDEITSEKKWVLLQNARHMTYVDKQDEYISALMDFLN